MEVTTTILSLQTHTSTLLFTLTPSPPELHGSSGFGLPSHTFVSGSPRIGQPPKIDIPGSSASAQISSKLTTEVVTLTIVTVVPVAFKPGLVGSLTSESTLNEGSAPGLSSSQTTAPGLNSSQSLATGLNSSQSPAPGSDSSQTLAPGQIPSDPTPDQSGDLTTPALNSTPTPPPPLPSSRGASERGAPLQTIDDGAPDFQVSHSGPDTKLPIILPVVLISLLALCVLAYIILHRYYRKLHSRSRAAFPTPFYISSTTTRNHSILAATRTTQSHRRSAKHRSIVLRHPNGSPVSSQERLVQRNGGEDRERSGRVGLSAPIPVPEVVSGGALGGGGRSAPATRSDFLDLRARLASIEAQILPPEYASENGQ